MISLSPDSRSQLTRQVALNGTFVHVLLDERPERGLAWVTIDQCTDAVHAQIKMGRTVNSITLARRDDTAERLARFMEEIANGETSSSVPEVDEYLLVTDLEAALRDAIRTGQGTNHLPVDTFDTGLCLGLLLRSAVSDPRRTVFRFELNGENLTLPMLLPTDPNLAYELLESCVRELIANYRSSAV